MLEHDIVVTDRPADVRADWARLEADGLATPFQTWAWLDPWRRTIAPAAGATALYVAVRDAANAPLMLLPLCRRDDAGHDVIEFADLGVSDYNAPLLARGFAPSASEMADLWGAIRAALPRADLVRIDKAPAAVEGRANPFATLGGVHRLGLSSWGVSLDGGRAAFEANALSSTFAKELRKKNRRIESRGATRFALAASVGEALDMFATLADMRGARFAELGRHNILADPAARAFYDEAIREGFHSGGAVVGALDVGDQRVATMFGLRRGASFHLLMSTFRAEEWKSCSPGNVLIDRAITTMAQAGVTLFDFTIGDEAYKRDFGATEAALYGGVAHLSLSGMLEAVKGQIKGVLRNRLRASGGPQAARVALEPENAR